MLELILTRPYEDKIVKAAQGLRFLVLDELHTYRGRQGADVALLGRRVREACNAANLQSSARRRRLAGPGTVDEQRVEVARVASLLFGATVEPENVIGETLQARDRTDAARRSLIHRRAPQSDRPASTEQLAAFTSDPLASWIETTFGLETEPSDGEAAPCGAAVDHRRRRGRRRLAALTGAPAEQCAAAIRDTLMQGYRIQQENGFPVFAFRVHQFFSRGETVYASLESETDRYVTTAEQQYVPGDREKVLVPPRLLSGVRPGVLHGQNRQGCRRRPDRRASPALGHDRRRRDRRRIPLRELGSTRGRTSSRRCSSGCPTNGWSRTATPSE